MPQNERKNERGVRIGEEGRVSGMKIGAKNTYSGMNLLDIIRTGVMCCYCKIDE